MSAFAYKSLNEIGVLVNGLNYRIVGKERLSQIISVNKTQTLSKYRIGDIVTCKINFLDKTGEKINFRKFKSKVIGFGLGKNKKSKETYKTYTLRNSENTYFSVGSQLDLIARKVV